MVVILTSLVEVRQTYLSSSVCSALIKRMIYMKIWDGFVRVYHWAQVVLIAALWWTAEEGEMVWHQWLAMTLLAFWLTRLGWGLFGSETARFSSFVKPPYKAIQYGKALVQGKASHGIGHDPLGAWMIVALLLILGVQMTSGLFATDEIFVEGPLAQYVSADVATFITQIHHMNFNVLLGLAAIHIAAVLIMQWRGMNLISPMIEGRDYVRSVTQAGPEFKPVWKAWVLFAVFWIGLYIWFRTVL